MNDEYNLVMRYLEQVEQVSHLLVMRYLEQVEQVSHLLVFSAERTEDPQKALKLVCIRIELNKHASRMIALLRECDAENSVELKLATHKHIVSTSEQALKDALNFI